MKIQSLSIQVPIKGCVNNCPFCVSRMCEGNNKYETIIDHKDDGVDRDCYTVNYILIGQIKEVYCFKI